MGRCFRFMGGVGGRWFRFRGGVRGSLPRNIH